MEAVRSFSPRFVQKPGKDEATDSPNAPCLPTKRTTRTLRTSWHYYYSDIGRDGPLRILQFAQLPGRAHFDPEQICNIDYAVPANKGCADSTAEMVATPCHPHIFHQEQSEEKQHVDLYTREPAVLCTAINRTINGTREMAAHERARSNPDPHADTDTDIKTHTKGRNRCRPR